MRRIIFVLLLLVSGVAYGQGNSVKPRMRTISIGGGYYMVQDLTPISGYTRIFARYEWNSGAFDSTLYAPRYNGVPTGARVNENSDIDGKVAVDTANHRLYFYSGGSWRYSTASTTGGSVPISSLTAATGTNTINNASYNQLWNWASLAGTTGLTLTSSSNNSALDGDIVTNISFSGANPSSGATTYSLLASNGRTGTSSTNVGIKAFASGGTNNYAAIFNPGSVGIGTNTPTSLLHVVPVHTTGIGAEFISSTTTSGTILDITGTSTSLAANNEGLNIGISGANGTNGITATGARISVTNTNATSGTNVALDLTASGAPTQNTALNVAAGDVLIAGMGNFADTTNFKPVVINTTGTAGTSNKLYKATYWPGGGGGGTPAGNFGNIQLNRNGAFATPASDSLDWESATGLSITGNLSASVQTTTPLIYGSTSANGDIEIKGTSSATKTTSYVNLQSDGGNVGIGTSTPTAKLTVNNSIAFSGTGAGNAGNITWGTGYGSPALTLYDGGAATRYGWGIQPFDMQFFMPSTAGHFFSWNGGGDFQTAGTNELMRLDANSGNLGIGTTTPTSRLNIVSGSNPSMVITQTGGQSVGLLAGTVGSSFEATNGGFFAVALEPLVSFGSGSDYALKIEGSTKNAHFGNLTYLTADQSSQLAVTTSSSSKVAFKVNAAASQTADLQQWNNSSGTALAVVNSSGSVGIGAASPTSRLEIAAGSATANTAPIELNSGTVETTARAGTIEYTTPQLFFTNGAAIRQEIPQIQQARVSTQYDNTTTTLGTVTGLTTNVAAGKTYRFEAVLYTTSNVAGGVKFAMAGTATATNIIYEAVVIDANVNAAQTRATALATTVGAVTAVTNAYAKITGTITVNAAGTFLVQAAANAATGTTSVLVGSTFVITEML